MKLRVRLVTRIALAAGCAAALAMFGIALVFRGYVERILLDRVDLQLEDRAESAPILAAVGDRLAVSELNAVVDGARIRFIEGPDANQSDITVGSMPSAELPTTIVLGWSTVRADGENWRLYTVRVDDVPVVGDVAYVQLGAPLGDLDSQVVTQRRRLLVVSVFSILFATGTGLLFGRLAARPMRRLRDDAATLGEGPASDWRVAERYGVAEVDDVAAVLNAGLERVALESQRRQEALEAARAFTASAAHELRTPLASAVTNLDVARSSGNNVDAVDAARAQLVRMAATLSALRDLADAELAVESWFEPVDIADLVAVVQEDESRRHPDVDLALDAPPQLVMRGWADGLRMACANLVQNALLHGRPATGRPQVRIRVSLEGATVAVVVDDNGPGIPPSERARVLKRFERATSEVAGSGLGLALVGQVAAAHGGTISIAASDMGGASISLRLPLVAAPS